MIFAILSFAILRRPPLPFHTKLTIWLPFSELNRFISRLQVSVISDNWCSCASTSKCVFSCLWPPRCGLASDSLLSESTRPGLFRLVSGSFQMRPLFIRTLEGATGAADSLLLPVGEEEDTALTSTAGPFFSVAFSELLDTRTAFGLTTLWCTSRDG